MLFPPFCAGAGAWLPLLFPPLVGGARLFPLFGGGAGRLLALLFGGGGGARSSTIVTTPRLCCGGGAAGPLLTLLAPLFGGGAGRLLALLFPLFCGAGEGRLLALLALLLGDGGGWLARSLTSVNSLLCGGGGLFAPLLLPLFAGGGWWLLAGLGGGGGARTETSWLSRVGTGAVMTRLLLMSRRIEMEKRMAESSQLMEISCGKVLTLKFWVLKNRPAGRGSRSEVKSTQSILEKKTCCWWGKENNGEAEDLYRSSPRPGDMFKSQWQARKPQSPHWREV